MTEPRSIAAVLAKVPTEPEWDTPASTWAPWERARSNVADFVPQHPYDGHVVKAHLEPAPGMDLDDLLGGFLPICFACGERLRQADPTDERSPWVHAPWWGDAA